MPGRRGEAGFQAAGVPAACAKHVSRPEAKFVRPVDEALLAPGRNSSDTSGASENRCASRLAKAAFHSLGSSSHWHTGCSKAVQIYSLEWRMKHLPNGFVLPVVLSIATVPSAWAAGETPDEALYRLTYDVRDKAGGVLAQISNYMTRADKKTYGEQLLTLGPLCTEAVWEALRGGVALDTQIDYGTSDDVPELTSPLPLSQINEKVCLWGTDLGKHAGSAEKEAKDKKYESYMSVLKGDKKTVFYKEDLLRGGKTYYGPKRTVLKSPKDFQSASAW